MGLFLLFYFTAYGAMQAYIFFKIRPVLSRPDALPWIAAGFLAFMVLAPLPARWLERAGFPGTAGAIGSVAWTWMAVSLWFVAFGLCGDAWNLAMRGIGRFAPAAAGWRLTPHALVSVLCLIILGGLLWGHFVQSRRLRIRRIELAVPRLPEGRRSLTVAAISDMHLGLYSDPRHVENVLLRLGELKPDLIVSAGDLLDSAGCPLDAVASELKALAPPLGKYAVLGNHDFYAGAEASLAFHERSGFRVLRGERVEPAPGLIIAGVDDAAGRSFGQATRSDEREVLPESAAGRTVILLKHPPSVGEEAPGRFTLQLSGHAHNGQIFPFTLVIAAVYRYSHGLYELPGGSRVYVSAGTATWGPRIRLFTESEITVFTLVPAP